MTLNRRAIREMHERFLANRISATFCYPPALEKPELIWNYVEEIIKRSQKPYTVGFEGSLTLVGDAFTAEAETVAITNQFTNKNLFQVKRDSQSDLYVAAMDSNSLLHLAIDSLDKVSGIRDRVEPSIALNLEYSENFGTRRSLRMDGCAGVGFVYLHDDNAIYSLDNYGEIFR